MPILVGADTYYELIMICILLVDILSIRKCTVCITQKSTGNSLYYTRLSIVVHLSFQFKSSNSLNQVI